MLITLGGGQVGGEHNTLAWLLKRESLAFIPWSLGMGADMDTNIEIGNKFFIFEIQDKDTNIANLFLFITFIVVNYFSFQ